MLACIFVDASWTGAGAGELAAGSLLSANCLPACAVVSVGIVCLMEAAVRCRSVDRGQVSPQPIHVLG